MYSGASALITVRAFVEYFKGEKLHPVPGSGTTATVPAQIYSFGYVVWGETTGASKRHNRHDKTAFLIKIIVQYIHKTL